MKKWKMFEKLVAAIHEAQAVGARVKWDDNIEGRQFDVTIRFKHGFYDYLTVIECKDTAERVNVSEVDAFVTKSRRARCDKAIMVASSGFQEGCLKVAKDEGISLFTLRQTEAVPDNILRGELIPVLNIFDFRLYLIGRVVSLRDSRGSLAYLVQNSTVVSTGAVPVSLSLIVQESVHENRRRMTPDADLITVRFPTGTLVNVPQECKEEPIVALTYRIRLTTSAIYPSNGLDPRILVKAYEFKDVIGDESRIIPAIDVKIKTGDAIEAGKFYDNEEFGIYYYCEAISDSGLISFIIVETYQHGLLWQIPIQQFRGDVINLIEVRNPQEIARLTAMLHEYRAKIQRDKNK